MANLVLHLKFEYYDAMLSGEKTEEYREHSKWYNKIEGKDFDNLVLWRGYQKGVFITLPWNGYEVKTITHPHFGDAPKKVYAIKVRLPR